MKNNYCPECGARLLEESAFCSECGTKIIQEENIDKTPLNHCTKCAYTSNEDEKFCPKCGAVLTSAMNEEIVLNSQVLPLRKKKSKLVAKTTTIPPIDKKKGGVVRKLGKGMLWIIAILVTLTIIFYFIGDDPASPNTLESSHSTITDIIFNPEPVKGSGTKAFEIEPIIGVVLKAKQGALDKNRDFLVEKLTDNQVKEIAENLMGITAVPLKGISIDSDMKDGEIFPGTLNVGLSLSEFNIPESMADYLCIIRTESDGTSLILPSNVENGQISFKTERNSIILIGLKLVAIGVVGAAIVTSIVDDATKGINSKDFHVINDIDGYSLYYPTTMIQPNPTEVKRVESIIIDVLKRNKIKVSESSVKLIMKSPDLMIKLWDVLQKDKNFLEAQKLLNDEQWKKDNLWPKGITEVVKTIRLADAYLFGNKNSAGRGFKRYDNIDIVVPLIWQGGSQELGSSLNLSSIEPYVDINLNKIPIHKARDKEFKNYFEELLPTMVHEIFHTSQVRYLGSFAVDRDKYLWFWEATAIAVEKQAREYFEDQQIISHDEMIISEQNSNYCQKNLAFIDYTERADLQNQGYAYAPLIEYISDQYAAKTRKNSEEYIIYVLEKFAELRDARATLIKTTTSSNHGFEKLYKNFCHDYLSDFFIDGYYRARNVKFPFPTVVNLTKGSPVFKVDHKYESLSMTMRKFVVQGADETEDNSVKLVLRGTVGNVMSYTDGFSIATIENAERVHYIELKQPSGMSTDEFDVEVGFGTVAFDNSFFLQEVNYDMDNSVNRSYEVFAMYKPATPSLTFDKLTENWYLKIKYDESNLKDMDYVDAYKITLRCPNGDIYSFITEENDFELPISYDKQTLSFPAAGFDFIHSIELTKADDNSTITGDFRLLYRELTSSDAKVMGPQSMPIKLAVDGIVDLTANTDELLIDEKINYKVTVTPDKKNYTYHWSIDGLVDKEGSSELQVNFKETGTYIANVTVSDNKGKNIGSDSWTCTVTGEEGEEQSNNLDNIALALTGSVESLSIPDDGSKWNYKLEHLRIHFNNDGKYEINGATYKSNISFSKNNIVGKYIPPNAYGEKQELVLFYDNLNSRKLLGFQYKKNILLKDQSTKTIISANNIPFKMTKNKSIDGITTIYEYRFKGNITPYIISCEMEHLSTNRDGTSGTKWGKFDPDWEIYIRVSYKN